jgi:hypothetical protein
VTTHPLHLTSIPPDAFRHLIGPLIVRFEMDLLYTIKLQRGSEEESSESVAVREGEEEMEDGEEKKFVKYLSSKWKSSAIFKDGVLVPTASLSKSLAKIPRKSTHPSPSCLSSFSLFVFSVWIPSLTQLSRC